MSGTIVLVLVGVAFLFVIAVYNKLVKNRNNVKNAFSQIDVQLKRRYDLIPNLVQTAKAYMQHEQETLEKVIQARNQAITANQNVAKNPAAGSEMKNLMLAEAQLGKALQQLMVVVESYPDLKASSNMMQITEELTSTENKISFARQAFNDAVMDYNNNREVFPQNVIAGMFNFSAAESFQITNSNERNNVKVSFT